MKRILLPLLLSASTASADSYDDFLTTLKAFSCGHESQKEIIILGQIGDTLQVLGGKFSDADVENTGQGYRLVDLVGEPFFLSQLDEGWTLYSAQSGGFFISSCSPISEAVEIVAVSIISISGALADADKLRLENEVNELSNQIGTLKKEVSEKGHNIEVLREKNRDLIAKHERELSDLIAKYERELSDLTVVKYKDDEIEKLLRLNDELVMALGPPGVRIVERQSIVDTIALCWNEETPGIDALNGHMEVHFGVNSDGKPIYSSVEFGDYQVDTHLRDDLFNAARKAIMRCGDNLKLDATVWHDVSLQFFPESYSIE